MNATDDEDRPPPAETTLLALYCVVLVAGVLANASLVLAVCNQHGSRNKNPLLIGLCVSDLLVCCLSAPITACFALYTLKPWPFAALWCKFAFFLQALPVTVSTLSMMVISVDRYITVKYPRPLGKFRHRKNAVIIGTVCVWLTGLLLTCPPLVVRRVTARSAGGRCVEVWSSPQWRNCFVFCHLVLVYVVPCVTVLACHMGVRAKLTALSLTARAAHGELPLPMPLLRRPTHVIIVAGLANNADGKVMTYHPNGGDDDNAEDSSNDGKLVVDGTRNLNRNRTTTNVGTGSKRKHSRRNGTERPRRATKSEHKIREDNRKRRPNQASDAPARPATSTLQSRRRLANALVSAAAVFVGCWLPHVVCSVCAEVCALPGQTKMKHLLQFSLLLGHAHSVINPVIYWAMNHQSLHHCSCVRGSFLTHFRMPNTAYRNASSTNEAALGPFHPRFTRPPCPNNRANVRRQSSYYLY